MITIDYQSKTPLYEQIAERFQMLIFKGVLKPDEQIPSVRFLALKLSINPNTIQKAYAMLEQAGYIYSVKGRGNFVSRNAAAVNQKKEDFFRDLEKLAGYGKELGISCEEFCSYSKKIYEEGGTA